MKKGVLFAILIPLLILILAAGATFAYFTIISSPQKVFERTISKTFDMVKEQQKKYNTVKSNVELSTSIDSYNEDLKQINEISKDSKISLETETDLNNAFFYNNLKIVNKEDNLLDAELILQDQKLYLAFKDWFDKYIELPLEEDEISDLTETLSKNATLDITLAIETFKQELINEMSKQNFSKEKTIMTINGQNVKVTRNYLILTQEQQMIFIKELIERLKNNSSFQTALGDYNEEIVNEMNEGINQIDELINNTNSQEIDNNKKIVYSIYTSGLFGKIVAIDLSLMDDQEVYSGLEAIVYGNAKEFNMYTENQGNKDYTLKIKNNKQDGTNKGTITISTFDDGEEHAIVCNYEKNGNQTRFNADIEIEQNNYNISGVLIKNNNSYNGEIILTYKDSEYGSIGIKLSYQVNYNDELLKVNIGNNTVKMDEMTEEEQNELLTSVEQSKLYELVNGFNLANNINNVKKSMLNNESNEYVESADYRINYSIPDEWSKVKSVSGGAQFVKDTNIINIGIIEQNYETCLDMIDENYSNEFNVSDSTDYTINDLKYKYKTVVGGNGGYLYFVYPIDDNNTYMVSVETEDGDVSLEDVNYFLEILVTDIISNENIANELSETAETQLDLIENTLETLPTMEGIEYY